MELRVLSIRERELITALFEDVFSSEPWNDDWSDERQLNAYITDLAGQNNSLTLGFFDGQRIVGLSMGCVKHWHFGTEYCIEEFCIDRNRQGAGIGTAFMRAIEDYLRENGIFRIFLQTDRYVPAYAFYAHRGFHELTDHVSFAKQIGAE